MLKCVNTTGFSICPSVCSHSNSFKYSSNVLKFAYDIYVWYIMFYVENVVYGAHGLCTETHKRITIHYDQMEKTV